jgi:hypothetical protein
LALSKSPTTEDAVNAGGFLARRPQDIIEALKAVEKRYPGLDRVICVTPLSTPLDVRLDDLDRFAKEVIPTFRDTRSAAAAQYAQRTAAGLGSQPIGIGEGRGSVRVRSDRSPHSGAAPASPRHRSDGAHAAFARCRTGGPE